MNLPASRLCKACGLCCNGVLFHTVHLQKSDSRQELKALGMLVTHKKKYDFFRQPCTSFKEGCCSIYHQRPERCRLFECQQLKRLAAGETTEEKALNFINEAHSKIAKVQQLLQAAGSTNSKKPLSKQYEKIFNEPLAASDAQALQERSQLTESFQELQQFLNQQFRIDPLPILPS